MVKDYGMCSCGGRIHPQWFFGKKYLECAKCGNPVKNAEQEEDYFVFADGTTMIEAFDLHHDLYLQWKIPYSEIRDYVNGWADNLKSDQDWRAGSGPLSVAYDFAYQNWADEPYGMNWAENIKDAIISRLRTSDGFPTSVTYDLDEPMTKAEIRAFLTGIPSWKLTKRAESKKLPPVEKAIDSGIASGATMEGLDLALGAEHTCSSCASPISEDDIIGDGTNRGLCCVPDYYDDDPLESWMEDFDAETERWIRIPSPTKHSPFYGKGYAKKRIFPNEQEARRDYEKLIREEPSMTGYRGGTNIGVECGCGNFVLKEEPIWNHGSQIRGWDFHNHPIQVHSKNIDRSHHYWGHEPTSEEWEFATRWKEGEKNIVEIEGATKDWLEFERITYMPMRMLEAEDTEHPSVYWFIKGEIMERQREQGKVTENDLDEMVEIVATKAPLWMIDKGMREAERLGDRGPWEILKMAAINRIILEDMDDKEVFSERLGEYRAEEVVMIECPHCYEFGDGEIPADIHYDPGDRWEPPSLDVNSWETCEWCEGKGEVTEEEAEGIPAWDWDILEPDEPHYDRWDAETWFDNMNDGDYFDRKIRYNPFTGQKEQDPQLEESIKRTKMSAIRTGLAITTFGIVLWNLWTNKKQEAQIDDIMGLV